MRKILTLLLCLGIFSSQAQTLKVGLGEYVSGMVRTTDHTLWDITQGKPLQITFAAGAAEYAGGAHQGIIRDITGDIWGIYDNATGELGLGNTSGVGGPTHILTDSNGNAIHNVTKVICSATGHAGYWYSLILKLDHTVWIAGNTQGGIKGDGSAGLAITSRFAQVRFPVGVNIVDICGGYGGMALDDQGNLWTWGADNSPYVLGRNGAGNFGYTPAKVTFPAGALPILAFAGGDFWNYAVGSNHHTYAWGGQFYPDYLAVSGRLAQMPIGPIDITTDLAFPAGTYPAQIGVNNESSYAILNDGSLWAWGGNAVGSIGNGIELDYVRYGGYPVPYGTTNPFPYSWDQGSHELQQVKPVCLAPLKFNWTVLSVGNANNLNYTASATDANDSLYFWGRNKGAIPNGMVPVSSITGLLQSNFPNSWDVPPVTYIDPFSYPATIPQSSPWCKLHPTNSICVQTTAIPSIPNPIVSAGTNGSTGSTAYHLVGSATPNGTHKITYIFWKQVSGPTTAVFNFLSRNDPWVSNLTSGSYVFRMIATDDTWNRDSSQVTVTVGNIPPTATAVGTPGVITLPVNSTTIVGTMIANGSASLVGSPTWVQTFGPSVATISNTHILNPTVSNLIQGTYTFQISQNDNNGLTGIASCNVTVNPSGSCNCTYIFGPPASVVNTP